jgi:hypothetical protein
MNEWDEGYPPELEEVREKVLAQQRAEKNPVTQVGR